jgi:nucleoside-diphosphate-sugar epimerase
MHKARVFVDGIGNRMIFPGWIWEVGDDTPATMWAAAMEIRAAVGLRMEEKWLEFDPANFPHIKMDVGHAGFAHGSEQVYLFAGPAFDEQKALSS